MPVKMIPDFLPMREELYGSTDAFCARILPDNLPEQSTVSVLLSDPGYQTARSAFDRLFLPFAQEGWITDTARRNALSAIRIGNTFPFPPSADTDLCIAAVMNHLSRRYLEEERSGEAVSILQKDRAITFGEAAFVPPERSFLQRMLPYVQKEKAQYQSLLRRNEDVQTLCSRLTAELSKQKPLSQKFIEETPEELMQQMNFSDPVSTAKNYAELVGTPVAQRLKPQIDYYDAPSADTAVSAWDSVQDGFAIDEYLSEHPADPRLLTEEQLSTICRHPHITHADSAVRLLEVHRINSPMHRSLVGDIGKERSAGRESVSLSDLNDQIIREGKTTRVSQEKERKLDGPNKQN